MSLFTFIVIVEGQFCFISRSIVSSCRRISRQFSPIQSPVSRYVLTLWALSATGEQTLLSQSVGVPYDWDRSACKVRITEESRESRSQFCTALNCNRVRVRMNERQYVMHWDDVWLELALASTQRSLHSHCINSVHLLPRLTHSYSARTPITFVAHFHSFVNHNKTNGLHSQVRH